MVYLGFDEFVILKEYDNKKIKIKKLRFLKILGFLLSVFFIHFKQ